MPGVKERRWGRERMARDSRSGSLQRMVRRHCFGYFRLVSLAHFSVFRRHLARRRFVARFRQNTPSAEKTYFANCSREA